MSEKALGGSYNHVRATSLQTCVAGMGEGITKVILRALANSSKALPVERMDEVRIEMRGCLKDQVETEEHGADWIGGLAAMVAHKDGDELNEQYSAVCDHVKSILQAINSVKPFDEERAAKMI